MVVFDHSNSHTARYLKGMHHIVSSRPEIFVVILLCIIFIAGKVELLSIAIAFLSKFRGLEKSSSRASVMVWV